MTTALRTVVFTTLVTTCVCLYVPNIDETINYLHNLVINTQDQDDVDFKTFPWTWEKLKGMYSNEVKLNFHGNIENALIRESFKVPDNNMFTPAWVTLCLLEAYEYGLSPKPRDSQISMALNAIDRFRNRNVPYTNSEMSFWMQTYNSTAKFYQSSPSNLFKVLELPSYLPDKLFEEILDMIGLKGLGHIIERLVNDRNMFLAAFHIPPDFDDTFVNLGLGGLLSFFKQDFQPHYELWTKQNTNLSSIFNSAKKYTYRPFSGDQRLDTIDPRTYFYMRQFLDNAAATGHDLALIPTWIQDTDEVRVQYDKGVAMPFNVNNVDITVSANFLFGVITCAGTGVCPNADTLIDATIQQMFENTTSLIVHEIKTNLSSRPDLALTYYPSKFEFYWFVSRSYAWLNRHLASLLPTLSLRLEQMLTGAKNAFGPVLRDEMTADILNASTVDGNGYAFVDDFLGDADVDVLNNSIPKYEDRVFSTAMSVNALISTWTNINNGTLVWEKDTPDDVKTFIEAAVKWLTDNVETKNFRLWNTFFSGSGKGMDSMPFSFPANRHELFNGTTFSIDKFPPTYKNILGMKGHVTKGDYDVMLDQPHFGELTHLTFDGYNDGENSFFPFWSSDAYTYATSLVALSHFRNIQDN